MAPIIWTANATRDLREISGYIEIEDTNAARRIVDRIYQHVTQLEKHPLSGSILPELEYSRYRQIVEPPCRIFYEIRNGTVYILHVLRFERILRISRLENENKWATKQ